jgi:hypothetical protein
MEEHGLRLFENRVLKRIIVHKGEKVIGAGRKLYSEKLHNLPSLPKI